MISFRLAEYTDISALYIGYYSTYLEAEKALYRHELTYPDRVYRIDDMRSVSKLFNRD